MVKWPNFCAQVSSYGGVGRYYYRETQRNDLGPDLESDSVRVGHNTNNGGYMVLHKRLVSTIAVSLLLMIMFGFGQAEAKVTGKISGAVIDVSTGEPVEGATVSVEGTTIATKTDEDGEYFLINLPVGQSKRTRSN